MWLLYGQRRGREKGMFCPPPPPHTHTPLPSPPLGQRCVVINVPHKSPPHSIIPSSISNFFFFFFSWLTASFLLPQPCLYFPSSLLYCNPTLTLTLHMADGCSVMDLRGREGAREEDDGPQWICIGFPLCSPALSRVATSAIVTGCGWIW